MTSGGVRAEASLPGRQAPLRERGPGRRDVRDTALVKVVIAPDKFAGTLTAVQAAGAIAAGWRRGAPHDELHTAPLSDGGPGFVDVLQAAVGGELRTATVTGPLGDPVPATVLLRRSESGNLEAYVECAQACGLHLVPAAHRDPWAATTFGVGELVATAIDAGATRVTIGLGGSATNDGGAGLLAALGAEPIGALRRGPGAFTDLGTVELLAALDRVAGVDLVIGTDVDNPLLGLRGATNVYGPQKGARAAELPTLDAALARLAAAIAAAGVKAELATTKGAGAAGGLGFGLLALGARRVTGFATVADIVGLAGRLTGAQLVLTGEGSFDSQSFQGKVVSGVAVAANEVGAPVVVLAGRVEVGRREMNAHGIEAAYGMADLPGGLTAALNDPAATLAVLAERTARNWSPGQPAVTR